jgi:Tol biopolymer transport system component
MKAQVALAAIFTVAAVTAATSGASRSTAPPIPLGHDIYSISISGGTPTRLTTDPLDELSPSVSPDGTTIAFSRGRDLWLMSADGNKQRMLVRAPENVSYVQPSWSRDGRFLAFTAWESSTCPPTGTGCAVPSVDVVRADRSGLSQIRSWAMAPRWSPRGQRLVFAGAVAPHENEARSIVTFSLTGNGRRLVSGTGFVGSPSWSPDGRRVLYTRLGARGPVVYVVRSDRPGSRRLRRGDRAEWSPAGDRIAVEDRGRVYVIRARGQLRAKQLAVANWYSWNRRGDLLALLGSRLAVIRPSGRSYRMLCCELGSGFGQDAPAWSPRGDRLFYAFKPNELPPR